mmetsp:Transcript_35086/g.75769  ORF Transcript_35086/g.75769 Transcript_35086/m.75769 type:complete len:84 (-) Transcript_35086:816-1067(-)
MAGMPYNFNRRNVWGLPILTATKRGIRLIIRCMPTHLRHRAPVAPKRAAKIFTPMAALFGDTIFGTDVFAGFGDEVDRECDER